MTHEITVSELITERRVCECCGKVPVYPNYFTRHHCIIPDMKRYHALLTVKENCALVCSVCHIDKSLVNGYEFRSSFWITQCTRYGESYMIAWLDSLPLKVKPIFPKLAY